MGNHHFWLQFSIADIALGDFELAERHLKQAYAIARRIDQFDTYQIDNVWALYLLMRSIAAGPTEGSFREFVEFNQIIGRQLRERRHGYYPYRVARHYKEFWMQIAKRWAISNGLPEHLSSSNGGG